MTNKKAAAFHIKEAQAWLDGTRSCTNYTEDNNVASIVDALTAQSHATLAVAFATLAQVGPVGP